MSGYIGPLPVPQGIQRKQSFTATASQTTFNTNGYTDGDFINVYLNGVRLINGTDYTATNGSDIVLTTGASASDVLDFETFQTFQLVDQQFENVTLKNPTHEDTDGGRESVVSFKGEQSGGEISTLAQIQASHDGTSDDQKGDLIFKTNDGSDNDAPTEAMRIDSSQNLLVGTTDSIIWNESATDNSKEGVVIEPKSLQISRYQDTQVLLNRQGNDGKNIVFAQDGTEVGSIRSRSGLVSTIVLDPRSSNNGGVGLGATGDTATPSILPSNHAGTITDDHVTIGTSGGRFKDLYLSGGAYIGGTGAVNYLDDYETGSWTPTFTASGYTFTYVATTEGRYVKVGKLVHLNGYMRATPSGSGTTQLQITGLPFSISNVNNSSYTAGSLIVETSGSLFSGIPQLRPNLGGTTIPIFQVRAGQSPLSSSVNVANLSSNMEFEFQVTYHTA